MIDYPRMAAAANRVEPVPRRIRGRLGDQIVLDTTTAYYVWEWENYPQYYVPVADIRADVLIDEQHVQSTRRGPAHIHGLRLGDQVRAGSVKVFSESPIAELNGTARIDWTALDAWYEEDEQVFVHPRNPYVRVDALRSTRHIRVEFGGLLLAESTSPVLLFETGLPTRYYLNKTEVRFEHLRASGTRSECPYKGTTTGYWSVQAGDELHPDLAWSYDFPLPAVDEITGLIAFYNEKVDIVLDGRRLERPKTHFFS
jgi:uncharacterized protein (DUF427 family)